MLLIVPCLATAQNDVNYYMNLGKRARETNNLLNSLRYFKKAQLLDPLSSDIFLNIGVTFGDKSDLDSALYYLEKATILDSLNHEAFAYMANAYLPLDDYNKGMAAINKALQIKSGDARYLSIRALFEIDTIPKTAIQDLTLAIEADSTESNYYYNRARAYSKLNNDDQAILDLYKALEYNPEYVKAYINRAHLFRKKEAYEMAKFDLNKAIQLDDKCSMAYLNRGLINLQLKKKKLAYEDFLHAYYLGNENAESVIKEYCPARYRKLINKKQITNSKKIISL